MPSTVRPPGGRVGEEESVGIGIEKNVKLWNQETRYAEQVRSPVNCVPG